MSMFIWYLQTLSDIKSRVCHMKNGGDSSLRGVHTNTYLWSVQARGGGCNRLWKLFLFTALSPKALKSCCLSKLTSLFVSSTCMAPLFHPERFNIVPVFVFLSVRNLIRTFLRTVLSYTSSIKCTVRISTTRFPQQKHKSSEWFCGPHLLEVWFKQTLYLQLNK